MPNDSADDRSRDASDAEPMTSDAQPMTLPPTDTRIEGDEIAARAYELYESRGGEHGHDWDDWLEAERQLRERKGGPGPTPS